MVLLRDGLRRLLESGLFFEINRRVLHPFGYALSVIVSDENEQGDYSVEFGGVRETLDVTGIIFADDLLVEGQDKYRKYLLGDGGKRLNERQKQLGYIIQGDTDGSDVVAEQEASKALWEAAKTSLEAKLQQELRRLHAVIKGA